MLMYVCAHMCMYVCVCMHVKERQTRKTPDQILNHSTWTKSNYKQGAKALGRMWSIHLQTGTDLIWLYDYSWRSSLGSFAEPICWTAQESNKWVREEGLARKLTRDPDGPDQDTPKEQKKHKEATTVTEQ